MCDDVLREGLEGLGLEAGDSVVSALSRHMEEIALFNPVYKLVSYSDGRELAVRHILDCASGVAVVRSLLGSDRRVADLGSGAGLPGIVLAILMGDVHFTLIERMERRASFLRNAVAACRLSNVDIVCSDVKDVRETFPLVTFRAFHMLGDIMPSLERLVQDEGTVCAYKARKEYVDGELESIAGWQSRCVELAVPFLDEPRMMLVMKRERSLN